MLIAKSIPQHVFQVPLLYGLLFMSGLCGIAYEVLYSRIIADWIGDQFIVSASILLTFLLGIGLGTRVAHRLWRYLWLLEACIGLYALIMILFASQIDHLIYRLPLIHFPILLPLITCSLLILLPAILIGTSLPIFAGYLQQLMPKSATFSFVYAIYNLAAALMVLIIEFGLIRWLGIQQSMLFIAMINGVVAFVLWYVFADIWQMPPIAKKQPFRLPKQQLLALILASIASAIFQLLMIKIVESLLGPFRETFAYVLSMILFGIVLGASIVHWLKLKFAILLIINIAALMGLLAGFPSLSTFYAHYYPVASEQALHLIVFKWSMVAAMMLLPALSFGATIPALLQQQTQISRDSGYLLFVSALANAFGFLIMTLYLHRQFDYGTLILIIIGLSSLALCIYVTWNRLSIIIMLVIIGFSMILHRQFWQEDRLYFGYTAFHSSQRLDYKLSHYDYAERFKGGQDIFAINWIDSQPYFFINGYTSIPLNDPSEKMVGAIASIFAPKLDQALVLGVGSGATAATVGLLFQHTDTVEINKVALDNLYRMQAYNFDIENIDRVNLIHDDAMHYVKASDKTYSLIVNTVTTPLYFSSSKLYTLDFLQHIQQRLKPDGVYVTWVDSRIGEQGLSSMLSTLGTTFQHCGLASISVSYFLLLCSDQPIYSRHPDIIAKQPQLAKTFAYDYQINPNWLGYFLLSADINPWYPINSTQLNTLDYPYLAFAIARLQHRGYRQFQQQLRDHLSLTRLKSAFPQDYWQPLHLLRALTEAQGEHLFIRRWQQLIKASQANFESAYAKTAIQHYQATHLPPKTAKDYYQQGSFYLRQDHYAAAIQSLKTALQYNPSYNNAWFNLGAAYEYQSQYNNALIAYKKEQLVDPNDRDISYRIGRVYYKLKQYQPALSHLQQAISHDPTANAYYYYASSLAHLGQIDKAKAAYYQALKLDPSHYQARRNLIQIHRNK